MMKRNFLIALVCLSSAGPAVAQAPVSPLGTPGVATEAEAKATIRAQGFMAVSNLNKNGKGEWQASAMKDGTQVAVTLDVEGNVNIRAD